MRMSSTGSASFRTARRLAICSSPLAVGLLLTAMAWPAAAQETPPAAAAPETPPAAAAPQTPPPAARRRAPAPAPPPETAPPARRSGAAAPGRPPTGHPRHAGRREGGQDRQGIRREAPGRERRDHGHRPKARGDPAGRAVLGG